VVSSIDQSQGLGESTSQAVGQAQEKVQQVAEQAREKAVEATEEGRNLIRSQVEERTSQAGQKLHSTTQDLRTIADALREQGQDGPARIAEQIADKGEQVAGYLRTSDGDRLLRDVEDFGRRNPWAVIAGGVFLGFAASRFVRSSSALRYNSNYVSTRSTDQLRSQLQSSGTPTPSQRQVSGFSESPVSEGL
jgi:vacuolar-type H+-ATPase subunit H